MTEKKTMSSDPFERAFEGVEDLYLTRDTYFPGDPALKRAKLEYQSQSALSILESIPLERRQMSLLRATYSYLKGKILDVFPEYCKEAEEHLSKAVKLNPSLADGCLSLGNCFWKKGDLALAKNCFMLSLQKNRSKKILCQLSILERQMARGTDNEVKVAEESILHAKEAVMMDVKDGHSWYALGNAYLSGFFITGAWDQNKLQQALKAYQNAEKDDLANKNPDLFFNCAMVNRYLENYERALSGFEAASKKDPSLNADVEVQKLVQLLAKLEELSINKGGLRSKKLTNLVCSLANSSINIHQKIVMIQVLQEGMNKGFAALGKVLLCVKHENLLPLYYIICDAEGCCCVLSIYGLRNGVIKEYDTIALLDPTYHHIHVTWKDKVYEFKSIRVDFVQQILVNGCALSLDDAVCSTIHAQHVMP